MTPTEKEKMLRGELYNAHYDPGLLAERQRAQSICHQYNSLPPADTDGRQDLLGRLLGRKGAACTVTPPFHCDYGYNIRVGDNFYSNYNLVILDCAPVTFGRNVLVGPDCGFYTAEHPLDVRLRNSGLETARPITVGDNVWIGGHVTVLPGVTIGEGSVIGAGSVVTRDIPARVVAAGNPCRVLRKLPAETAGQASRPAIQ